MPVWTECLCLSAAAVDKENAIMNAHLSGIDWLTLQHAEKFRATVATL